MRSALHCLLLFSALWTLSLCGTRQYHLVTEGKTWTNAQKYCRENFTDLATIENDEERETVEAAVNGTTNHFWIGLRQNPGQMNNSWIWSDGSNSSYRNWYPGQPDDTGNDVCVELSTFSDHGYRWRDDSCLWPNQFFCYEAIPFVLIRENKTWWEALRYCRKNHVDLVSVHTEEIQLWVEAVSRRASTDNVWIGLRHTCDQGFWFWVRGLTLCYENWAPGNGTGVEDCSKGERSGAVESGTKKWVSLSETQTLNFICTDSEEF